MVIDARGAEQATLGRRDDGHLEAARRHRPTVRLNPLKPAADPTSADAPTTAAPAAKAMLRAGSLNKSGYWMFHEDKGLRADQPWCILYTRWSCDLIAAYLVIYRSSWQAEFLSLGYGETAGQRPSSVLTSVSNEGTETTRAVWSLDAVTTRLPSGLNAALTTNRYDLRARLRPAVALRGPRPAPCGHRTR